MFVDRHDQEVWIREKIENNLSFVRNDGTFDFCVTNYGQVITGKATVRMRFDKALGTYIPYVIRFVRCPVPPVLNGGSMKIRKVK